MEPTVELREYIEAQIHALDVRLSQRLDLEQRAVQKAEQSMAARLEGLNELRGAMRDQTAQFVTRGAFDAKVELLITRITSVEHRLANYDGRLLILAAAVSIAVSLTIAWMGR